MAIKLPVRNYFTFQELIARWQCSENELKHAVIIGNIKPSIRLNGEFNTITWQIDSYGNYFPKEFFSNNLENIEFKFRPHGWLYLQDPIQTGPFEGEFGFASDDRDPDKDEMPFSSWFKLKKPFSVDEVKNDAAFLLTEIAAYECQNSIEFVKPSITKPLNTRERENLLRLVIGMAIRGYGHDPLSQKSTVPKEIANDLIKLGMGLSDDTVRKYLKQAAETVLPSIPRAS